MAIWKWWAPWRCVHVYEVSSFRFLPCHASCSHPRCCPKPPRLGERATHQCASPSPVFPLYSTTPSRVSLTFPHPHFNSSPSNQCPPFSPTTPVCPFPTYYHSYRRQPPTFPDSPGSVYHTTHYLPFSKRLFPLLKPALVLLPPTPSPLLNHRTIQTAKTHHPRHCCDLLPLPLFWPTPAPPTFCYESLFCLPSPTSRTLPSLHPCLSPYQMVPFSPPNLAVTFIFRAYLSPSLFGPPLTPFCPTLS